MKKKEVKNGDIDIEVYDNDRLTKDEELELGAIIQSFKSSEEQYSFLKNKANRTPSEDEKFKSLHIEYQAYNQAINKLIENYTDYARQLAHKIHRKTGAIYPIEDCIQEAMFGLFKAASRFDPSKNCKLNTYAFYAITKAVSVAVNENRPVRIPENKMGDWNHILQAEKEYATLKDETISEEEFVIEKANITKEEYRLLKKAMQPPERMNATIKDSNTEQSNKYTNLQENQYDIITNDNLSDQTEEIHNGLDQYSQDLLSFEFDHIPASMSYEDFKAKYNYTDRQVASATKRLLKELRDKYSTKQ